MSVSSKIEMPKVSVIIPTYNSAKYLAEAIDSIIGQTYQSFEIIIIDDGSIDNTTEIVNDFINRYPLIAIRYIYQQNKGPSSARNVGIENSKCEYIAFLDADDLWLPLKLELQLDAILQSELIGIVTCDAYYIDSFGKIFKEAKYKDYSNPKLLRRELMLRNVVSGGSSALVRRKCFNEVGLFDETLRGSEDRDMWFRAAKFYEIKLVTELLIKIRQHENNASSNVAMIKLSRKKFIRKNIGDFSWVDKRKAYSYIYFDAAREYLWFAKRIAAFMNSFMAIILYPFKIYQGDNKYRIFIISLFPQSLHKLLKKINKRLQRLWD